MNEENIVRYSRDNLPKDTKTDWARLAAMTEEEIEANALSDPDNLPIAIQCHKNNLLSRPPIFAINSV